MTHTIERRTLFGDEAELELRNLADGKTVLGGYCPVYDRLSRNMGGFVERIEPGAATRTIANDDIYALWNHDPMAVLGRSASGTLRVGEDTRGVHWELTIPDTTLGRDIAELHERGDVTGASHGFRNAVDRWDTTDDGFPVRVISSFQLRDISPTAFPAYADATSDIERRSIAFVGATETLKRPLDEIIAAAEAGELADIIRNPETIEERNDDEDSGETGSDLAKRLARIDRDKRRIHLLG